MSSDPRKRREPVVSARDLRKEFELFASPWHRLQQWLSRGRVQRGERFVALEGITFDLHRGESLGILGPNGAGKSTLLKLLAGVMHPSAGSLAVRGRVASLLELGTGFQPEFTGRQNLVFNARFLGLNDMQIRQRMADMIGFAELQEFIDRPLRTYSTGMQLRLGFAVAAHTHPDVFVVDEALAVGDALFTRKCIDFLRCFRAGGGTLVFATHDLGMVKSLCDTALLMDRGRVVSRGAPRDVVEIYNQVIARRAPQQESVPVIAGPAARGEPVEEDSSRATDGNAAGTAGPPRRSGNFGAAIRSVKLTDRRGDDTAAFVCGETVTVTMEVCFLTDVENPTLGILVRDRNGNDIYGTNTHHLDVDSGSYRPGESLVVSFAMPLDLGAGEYTLTVAAHTLDVHIHESFDWIDRVLAFTVLPPATQRFIGPARLHPRVVLERRPRGPGIEWSGMLREMFGAEPPRALRIGSTETAPWMLRGWHAPEESPDGWFAWTRERCTFIIDLRGEILEMEVGQSPRPEPAVPFRVRVFDRVLATPSWSAGDHWATVSIPVPPELRGGGAVVTLEMDGWCPRDAGLSEDGRTLGLRVRRIEVKGAVAEPRGRATWRKQ